MQHETNKKYIKNSYLITYVQCGCSLILHRPTGLTGSGGVTYTWSIYRSPQPASNKN